MIHESRLQQILASKDADAAAEACREHGNASECWSIIDGVLVIYDETDPPAWLKPVLDAQDEDGNTPLA
jgi:hypothetical protein